MFLNHILSYIYTYTYVFFIYIYHIFVYSIHIWFWRDDYKKVRFLEIVGPPLIRFIFSIFSWLNTIFGWTCWTPGSWHLASQEKTSTAWFHLEYFPSVVSFVVYVGRENFGKFTWPWVCLKLRYTLEWLSNDREYHQKPWDFGCFSPRCSGKFHGSLVTLIRAW